MKKLAAAPLSHVVKLWEGLGYYRRAVQLHESAKCLSANTRVTVDDLRACPGIGPYTLAAVASIVLDEPLPVIDGNVKRVVARMAAIEAPLAPGNRSASSLCAFIIALRMSAIDASTTWNGSGRGAGPDR